MTPLELEHPQSISSNQPLDVDLKGGSKGVSAPQTVAAFLDISGYNPRPFEYFLYRFSPAQALTGLHKGRNSDGGSSGIP